MTRGQRKEGLKKQMEIDRTEALRQGLKKLMAQPPTDFQLNIQDLEEYRDFYMNLGPKIFSKNDSSRG